ncbi:unnamed protein product [Prunus brigantina]
MQAGLIPSKTLSRKTVVSRAYNKRVKNKSFEEGEIVRKESPLGTHMRGYGKWSPTWEGPFVINRILGMGAYGLQDRDGEIRRQKEMVKKSTQLWGSQAPDGPLPRVLPLFLQLLNVPLQIICSSLGFLITYNQPVRFAFAEHN